MRPALLNLLRVLQLYAQQLDAGGEYAAAPASGPGSDFLPLLRNNLSKMVATNRLQAFYPPQRLEQVFAALAQVDFRYSKVALGSPQVRSRVAAALRPRN